MLLLFPLLGLLLACGWTITREQHWQQGVLSGATIWGVVITAIAEGLGAIGQLTQVPVAIAWILVDLTLGVLWWRCTRRSPAVPEWRGLVCLTPTERLLLAVVVIMVGLTGVTAFVAPTNNWDSMTYHMSRVMHWLHNGRLDHYPTYYTPQLYHPPWAELAIAHLQVLTGGDRWANGVQWLSLIGSSIGAAAIARELGAPARGQVFAASFAVTLPMGLLQAATTQNDYAVCFWVICFAYSVVHITRSDRLTSPLILQAAATLGLALLTKTSAYLFSLPFLLWLFITVLYRTGWQIWRSILLFSLAVLAINAGHYLRNWEMFGSPITGGPEDLAVQYRMDIKNGATFLSNLVRNAAFHISSPFPWLNAKLNGVITRFHDLIGIAPNDPRTTLPGQKFGVFQVSFKEDLAGNTVHFLLTLGAIGAFLGAPGLRRHRLAGIYLLTVFGTYAVFCWMLKWQPFNSRHHLTLFVLLAPFVGWVLAELQWRRWMTGLMLVVAIASLPWVFNAEFRPWFGQQSIFVVPRHEQYFTQRRWIGSPYLTSSQFLNDTHCQHIGFLFDNDPSGRIWEYPLWVLMGNSSGRVKTIHHLRADNISKLKLPQDGDRYHQPCAIVSVGKKKTDNAEMEQVSWQSPDQPSSEPVVYRRSWYDPPVGIYTASGQKTNVSSGAAHCAARNVGFLP